MNSVSNFLVLADEGPTFCIGENYIRMGDEQSTSLIKGVPLGTLAPGVSTSIVLYLSSAGAVYERVIDISVQSHREVPASLTSEPESPQSPKSPTQSRVDRDEAIRTLVVPAVQPLSVEQTAVYRRSLKSSLGLADLSTYDDGYWDDGDVGEAIVTTTMACTAPSGIMVDSIKLVKQVCVFSMVKWFSAAHRCARMGKQQRSWTAHSTKLKTISSQVRCVGYVWSELTQCHIRVASGR